MGLNVTAGVIYGHKKYSHAMLCYCRLAVDGPFGAAATDVFQYQISVCIAAGIGVTPFASILKSIWYRCCTLNTEMSLGKVSNTL